MEAVTPTNAIKFINSIRFGSDENILKLFKSLKPKSRRHVLLSYFKQLKFNHVTANNKLLGQESQSNNDKEVFGCFGKILNRQLKIIHSRKDHPKPSICNISTELFAKIVSFVCMKDRLLNCERVSTQMYDVCQQKEAKHHLAVNKAFVKHTMNENVDLSKFKNIKHLCINFVLCNPNIRRRLCKMDFEKRFYQILNYILSASPKLNTIEYDLTENSFRSHFGPSNNFNKQYEGSLFDFASNLNSKYLKRVTKLIWTEKERRDICWKPGEGGKRIERMHQWLRHQKQISPFIQMFENVKTLIIPNHFNVSSFPMVSRVWSNKHYLKHLEHLHIDLSQIVIENVGNNDDDDDGDDDIVTEIGHPLTLLHKFKSLKSLHLKMPIFRDCALYYNALLHAKSYNQSLTSVSFVFCVDSDIRNAQTLNVINSVWTHMINNVCLNLKELKCVINNQSNRALECSHSYISMLNNQLESIVYESDILDLGSFSSMLSQRKWTKLKELTLSINDTRDKDTDYCLNKLKLSRFECLQSFAVQYAENCHFEKDVGFIKSVTQNILQFLDYVNKQNHISAHLRRIGVAHCAGRNKKYIPQIRGLSINASDSERICKLVSMINTKHRNIGFIDLCPIAVRLNELKFLQFWTNINVIEWGKVKKTYLVDLKLRN